VLLMAFYLTNTSCRKDKFNLNDTVKVNADTLWFDTVFTKVSLQKPRFLTKQILVHNPYNESIRTSIQLAGGANSHFRLNVDGEPGYRFNDVEILPKDSIFLFVEVHPDPNNNSPDFNPLIIRDSIIYTTNGKESKTMLIGWGQDAHYFFRDSIDKDTTWANDKLPIVVYGYFYVKPGAKLTIAKNMKIHFASESWRDVSGRNLRANGWLFVEGQLDMKGTKDEPIIMQGDRLQPAWEETAGQWGGIWISHPSYGNQVEHSILKNGTAGIYCDSSSGKAGQPNVTIKKTMIRNMSVDGISGKGSTIVVENTVSVNCGRFTFFGQNGGDYSVKNSTFYSTTTSGRQDETFVYLNVRRDELTGVILERYNLKYQFINNIIYGTRTDGEIYADVDFNPTYFDTSSYINYNLIKTKRSFFANSLFNNVIDKNPNFLQIDKYNFDLDTASAAKDKGILLSPPILDDYYNRPRKGNPDLGAFESKF